MAVIKMNFLSKTLGMQTNVTICLPSFSFADIMSGRKDVYVPGMKYQVLWLLHGGSGDDSDYVNFSNVVRYADDHKLAVVMPCDYNTSYTDDPQGAKYMTYITDELPEMCRALFPFSDKREDNFIGGLSMGAGGTMKIAMFRPENYCAALVMSGGLRNPNAPVRMPAFSSKDGNALPMPKPISWDITGTQDDVLFNAKRNVAEGRPLPKMFITCGDKDFAMSGSTFARDTLKELGYDVFWEEVPGYGHEWDFWDLTLRKAFKEWLPIRHSVIYPE